MIKAIETRYNGYRFRSRLEAKWAVFFNALGLEYEYEKEGFELPSGRYLPDFWLPELNTWVEIKPPPEEPPILNLYLAGKMGDWRDALDLRGHWNSGPRVEGKSHDTRLHGAMTEAEQKVIESCRSGISEASHIFCWIDSMDCYGTLVEIGYASALMKHITVAFSDSTYRRLKAKGEKEYAWEQPRSVEHGLREDRQAMWFIEHFADQVFVCSNPNEGLAKVLPGYTEAERKCLELSRGEANCALVYGEPYQGEYRITEFVSGRCWSREQVFCLWPDGKKRIGWGDPKPLIPAYNAARSARFEHGESG